MQPTVISVISADKKGLGVDKCDNVWQAIVLSRVRYALPPYYNYLTAATVNKRNENFS
jgi:hypothetical protein